MATPGAVVFASGDIVLYQEQICIIQEIKQSNLGFRRYTLNNIETGSSFECSKHEMQLLENAELEEIPEMNWDTELRSDSDVAPKKVGNTNTHRHALLSQEDMDSVAKERLSLNTTYQTQWAVSLFRGMYTL
jgi:hypothetical protein